MELIAFWVIVLLVFLVLYVTYPKKYRWFFYVMVGWLWAVVVTGAFVIALTAEI